MFSFIVITILDLALIGSKEDSFIFSTRMSTINNTVSGLHNTRITIQIKYINNHNVTYSGDQGGLMYMLIKKDIIPYMGLHVIYTVMLCLY